MEGPKCSLTQHCQRGEGHNTGELSHGNFRMRIMSIHTLVNQLKGTSNYLTEFQRSIETDSQMFLNLLYDISRIFPEIDINSPCSFPPGVSQIWWNLTIAPNLS